MPINKPAARRAFFENLGLCGCGSVMSTLEIVKAFLQVANAGPSRQQSMYDAMTVETSYGSMVIPGPAVELIALFLDKAGLIEHGTGIGWPWLTEEGEHLLDLFTELGCDPDKYGENFEFGDGEWADPTS